MKDQNTTLAAFKKSPSIGALLRKDLPVSVQPADEQPKDGGLRVHFITSTETPDRDGDTIAAAGWKLDHYRKNPVVLWAHDSHQPPVARSLREWVENNALHSEAEFTPQDLYPFGHMVGQMYQRGFLHAVSVGFRALKYAENTTRAGWYPVDFLEQELLEYSPVPVPANPEALAQAKSAGIDVAPAIEWAEKLLAGEHGPGFWVARKTLKKMVKAVTPRVVQVPAQVKAPDPAALLAAVKAGAEEAFRK